MQNQVIKPRSLLVYFLSMLTPPDVLLIIFTTYMFTLYAFQYGGELDSTGVWKLKWRAGALQPRKKAGKTQTPTLITSTHWPPRSATSNLVCLWTGIR